MSLFVIYKYIMKLNLYRDFETLLKYRDKFWRTVQESCLYGKTKKWKTVPVIRLGTYQEIKNITITF